MIGKYDFEIPEDGRILLNEDGFKKFCTEYERWMSGRNTASGEKSFRRCIRDQIAGLKKAVGEGEQYRELYHKLVVLMQKEKEGNIRIYHICGKCEQRVSMIGIEAQRTMPDREGLIII